MRPSKRDTGCQGVPEAWEKGQGRLGREGQGGIWERKRGRVTCEQNQPCCQRWAVLAGVSELPWGFCEGDGIYYNRVTSP